MIGAFVHDQRSPRVVFGAGARHGLLTEVERLGIERILVITTPGRAETATAIARGVRTRLAGMFDDAQQHVPRPNVEAARSLLEQVAADGYLTIGGGSAIGLGKALALETGAPIIAVPTTYAGSEVTPIWGITDRGGKHTGRSDHVLPRTVIYDPELTVDFPVRLAGASGMNAVAHCVEGLYAPDASPITSLLAAEGLRVLSRALVEVANTPDSIAARSAAMYGAYLAGMALAGATMGVHHRLCHLLGGTFRLPHAQTHAVLLPHVVEYEARKSDVRSIADALGSTDAAVAIFSLRAAVHAPASLRELGLTEADLERAVELATEVSDADARLTLSDARSILESAYHGLRPSGAE